MLFRDALRTSQLGGRQRLPNGRVKNRARERVKVRAERLPTAVDSGLNGPSHRLATGVPTATSRQLQSASAVDN